MVYVHLDTDPLYWPLRSIKVLATKIDSEANFIGNLGTTSLLSWNMDDREAGLQAAIGTFGINLKGLRSNKGWTLEELAERTGLSRPFLSRLEAGDRQPSIAAALTLAQCFGVPLGQMFESAEAQQPCVVVRAGESIPQQSNGLTFRALSNPGRFVNLQPIRLIVSHLREGDERYQHDGEEWVYVLSGRLRLDLGDSFHELFAGDAAHFNAALPHRLTALDGEDVELILVGCPLPGPTHATARVLKPNRAIYTRFDS